MRVLIVVIAVFCAGVAYSSGEFSRIQSNEDLSVFSGRISKLSAKASLMRVRFDFGNKKFLNKKDRVEFWADVSPGQVCVAYVIGKTNEYVLFKVPNYELCVNKVGFTVGAWMYFRSDDLKTSMDMAKELIEILLKKRMALRATLKRNKSDLDAYVEVVEAVNKRYDVLRQKLELEWEMEITGIESDRTMTMKKFEEAQSQLDDVDHKLESYKIQDHNLELDRWSLDSKLYKRK